MLTADADLDARGYGLSKLDKSRVASSVALIAADVYSGPFAWERGLTRV